MHALLRLFAFAGLAAALSLRADTPPAPAPVDPLPALITKPLYQFNEAEVGTYLPYAQKTYPALRTRIAHLARKNLGQPYELYLLGEAPFELIDPQPLYCLSKSDCLVFVEHTLAMSLSHDWTSFFRVLQRIRYTDGRIGVESRNHFTESDWNPANRWLATDITAEVAGTQGVKFEEKIDRTRFLASRYKLQASYPVVHHRDVYLPYAQIKLADAHVREGDLIEVVRGIVKPGAPVNDTFGGNAWIGHVGLVMRGPDGAFHILHSSVPVVKEETIESFIARETAHNAERDAAGKARLLGFKLLRLADDPLANLRKVDGPEAPRLTFPPLR